MIHNVRYRGVFFEALSTKQKQLVYKIGGSSFFNCCSDTTPVFIHKRKYTGVVQSFTVCIVRKCLVEKIFTGRNFSQMGPIRKIFRFRGKLSSRA